MTVYCAYCNKSIPDEVLKARKYSPGTMPAKAYCNREHRATHEQQSGTLKQMSEQGRERRIEAVAKSNRLHPRRKK